jgi:hypothetical protein
MDLTLSIAAALIGIGFVAGYAVRAWMSARRRKAAQRNRW